jgi:hypothetical protein
MPRLCTKLGSGDENTYRQLREPLRLAPFIARFVFFKQKS